MKRLLEVCLAGLSLVAGVAAVSSSTAQTLQKGISVEMAVTANATPMPEADNPDAWVVTVTKDSSLYFGTDPVTPEGLLDQMTRKPRNRAQKLYIKADVHAPYAAVQKVLEAARVTFFEAPVLLTSQPEQAAPGTIVPPKGLEVTMAASPEGAIVVQVLNSGQESSTLKVNNEDVPWGALQSALRESLQNRSQKVIVMKSDRLVPFAHVAHVIDVCHGMGARVVVPAPTL